MAAVSAASLVGTKTSSSRRPHSNVSVDSSSNGNARSHTWTKSQNATPARPLAQRRNMAAVGEVSSASLHNDSGSAHGLLAQLESDYASIKRVDAALHEQLGQWLGHMEQWMQVQRDLCSQLQKHCYQMDFDADSLTESPLSPNLPVQLLTPHSSIPALGNSFLSNTEKNLLSHVEGLRLPAAVAMKEPEDKTPLRHQHPPDARSMGNNVNAINLSTPPPMSQGDDTCKYLREPPMKILEDSSDRSQLQAFVSPRNVILEEFPTPLREHVEAVDVDKFAFEREDTDSDNSATTISDSHPTFRANAARDCQLMSSLEPHDYEALPKEYKMWVEVVRSILIGAKKRKYYELRECWKKEEQFMMRYLRVNGGLDLKVLVKPKPRLSRGSGNRNSYYTGFPGMAGIQHIKDHMPVNLTEFGNHFGLRQSPTFESSKARKSLVSTPSESERRKFSVILDPQSRTRLAWMALGMFFMMYDLIALPMQVFNIPRNWFTEGMQWIGQIFWTLDIGVTFITAVYIETELSVDFKIIAKAYLSSWFAFDVAIVAPLWFVQIAEANDSSEGQSGASNAAFFRFVRLMRFLRLARLAKFEHYLQEALAAVNSSSLMLLVGIFKLMIGMILVSHINACLWYWVGSSNGGWVGAYEGTSWVYLYLTSMHWAFTQFQGTSDILPGSGGSWVTGERAYAVCIVMGALILLSSFVGGLTNLMMQLHTIRESRVAMAHAVREFLNENEISKGLSIRVKKYIDWKQRAGSKMGKFDIVLRELPVALQIDLHEEVKAPLVIRHKFFSSLRSVHLRIFRLMCHGKLETLFPAPGEIMFTPHLEATKMFFCISGVSHYLDAGVRSKAAPRSAVKVEELEEMHDVLRRKSGIQTPIDAINNDCEPEYAEDGVVSLVAGSYLVEPVLWTGWEHCGVLMSVSDAQYYGLGGQDFEDLVLTYPPAHVSTVLYARRFVAGLNRFGRKFNDIIDITTFEEEEDSDEEEDDLPKSSLYANY